ncbi:30S ribosomal protein S19 [Candidatus Woesearchaeota archaeon]|nr:30S ribosomal protein S19 [Candidatus Woesearchaeota archaeon]
MAKKEFSYRGKSLDELKGMSISEISGLFTARARRTLKKGLTHEHKVVLEKVKLKDPNLKTHCRNMVVLPEMVNSTIKIHNGKEFVAVLIQPEMIGHYLGEFAMTRRGVKHSAPGIGATKSSSNLSVK